MSQSVRSPLNYKKILLINEHTIHFKKSVKFIICIIFLCENNRKSILNLNSIQNSKNVSSHVLDKNHFTLFNAFPHFI